MPTADGQGVCEKEPSTKKYFKMPNFLHFSTDFMTQIDCRVAADLQKIISWQFRFLILEVQSSNFLQI